MVESVMARNVPFKHYNFWHPGQQLGAENAAHSSEKQALAKLSRVQLNVRKLHGTRARRTKCGEAEMKLLSGESRLSPGS